MLTNEILQSTERERESEREGKRGQQEETH